MNANSASVPSAGCRPDIWSRSFAEEEKPTLVLYHANCPDGWAAAVVIHAKLGDTARYQAVDYHQPVPEISGERVLIVDFSYPYQVLKQFADAGNRVTVLDHHVGVSQSLAAAVGDGLVLGGYVSNRSGAELAWMWANRREGGFVYFPEMPRLVRAVAERDLHSFTRPDSKALCAYADTLVHDFDVWHRAMEDIGPCNRVMPHYQVAVSAGEACLRLFDRQIEHIMDTTRTTWRIGGHEVPVVNCPRFFASEAANRLALESRAGFAAAFVDMPDSRKVSLRAVPSVEILSVAKSYGGGGHAQAASFTVPLGWAGE